MPKLLFYSQFQFSVQLMAGVVLEGRDWRMALSEKLGFFSAATGAWQFA